MSDCGESLDATLLVDVIEDDRPESVRSRVISLSEERSHG
jgi:hypothetical protein